MRRNIVSQFEPGDMVTSGSESAGDWDIGTVRSVDGATMTVQWHVAGALMTEDSATDGAIHLAPACERCNRRSYLVDGRNACANCGQPWPFGGDK